MAASGDDRGAETIAFVAMVLSLFGLIYVVGRASIPTFRSAAEEILAEASATSEAPPPDAAEAVLLDDLRRQRLSESVPAVIDVMGAVDARYALEQAHAPTVWIPLQGDPPEPGEGFPIDVDVRFSTADTTLTVVAGEAEAGVARTDRMTVVLTTGGRSFVADAGECALELGRSGYASLLNPWVGEIIVPFFDGQIRCADVADIRSGETVSFAAVFDYEDH